MAGCEVDGCEQEHDARGYCSVHYQRFRAHGDPLKIVRRPRGVCSVEGCGRQHAAKGYCSVHYYRVQRNGDAGSAAITTPRKGADRYVNQRDGYARVRRPGHPRDAGNGWVREHWVVMEEALGRYLLPGEEIHHRNGVKDDNRLENLELWVVRQPKGQRPADLVAWAREILARYGDAVDALQAAVGGPDT